MRVKYLTMLNKPDRFNAGLTAFENIFVTLIQTKTFVLALFITEPFKINFRTMQLKKIFIGLGLIGLTTASFAQDKTNTPEPEEKFFKLENLFTGGNVSIGFGNGQFSAGAIPHFGYKLANWVDAGVVFNFAYNCLVSIT